MNLVGPLTIATYWTRHALDSSQLLERLSPDALHLGRSGARALVCLAWCWPCC
ncbi:hypothetical protein ACRAWD_16965 [Caulobacter segnis]